MIRAPGHAQGPCIGPSLGFPFHSLVQRNLGLAGFTFQGENWAPPSLGSCRSPSSALRQDPSSLQGNVCPDCSPNLPVLFWEKTGARKITGDRKTCQGPQQGGRVRTCSLRPPQQGGAGPFIQHGVTLVRSQVTPGYVLSSCARKPHVQSALLSPLTDRKRRLHTEKSHACCK